MRRALQASGLIVLLLVTAAAAAALAQLPPRPPHPPPPRAPVGPPLPPAPQWVITTVAGGDGQLEGPAAVAVASDATVYIADSGNYRVVRLGPDGKLTTIAGTGKRGSEDAAEGVLATEAAFKSVADAAIGPDGSLYIVDTTDERVRKVTPDGTITNVAGTGERPTPPAYFGGYGGVPDAYGRYVYGGLGIPWPGSYGYYGYPPGPAPPPAPPSQADGGPAAKASLNHPRGVAVADDGTIYIADSGFNRLRKIDTKGIITTIAGGDRSGYFGDGGPAVRAGLNNPSDVAVGSDGSVYIADTDNHRIRKVRVDGIIETVAGNGFEGHSGDGGPATEAMLRSPRGVAVADDGTLYIADTDNHRIRRVERGGRIHTISGTPWEGFSGDDGLARVAQFNEPSSIAGGPDGALYVADTKNNRVRKLWLERRWARAPDGLLLRRRSRPARPALE